MYPYFANCCVYITDGQTLIQPGSFIPLGTNIGAKWLLCVNLSFWHKCYFCIWLILHTDTDKGRTEVTMIASSNGNVQGIHRSLVNSPHKGQWRGALMFPLICAWTNGWANMPVIWDAIMPIMTSIAVPVPTIFEKINNVIIDKIDNVITGQQRTEYW